MAPAREALPLPLAHTEGAMDLLPLPQLLGKGLLLLQEEAQPLADCRTAEPVAFRVALSVAAPELLTMKDTEELAEAPPRAPAAAAPGETLLLMLELTLSEPPAPLPAPPAEEAEGEPELLGQLLLLGSTLPELLAQEEKTALEDTLLLWLRPPPREALALSEALRQADTLLQAQAELLTVPDMDSEAELVRLLLPLLQKLPP